MFGSILQWQHCKSSDTSKSIYWLYSQISWRQYGLFILQKRNSNTQCHFAFSNYRDLVNGQIMIHGVQELTVMQEHQLLKWTDVTELQSVQQFFFCKCWVRYSSAAFLWAVKTVQLQSVIYELRPHLLLSVSATEASCMWCAIHPKLLLRFKPPAEDAVLETVHQHQWQAALDR